MSRRHRSTHHAARASGRLLVSLAMLAIVAVSLPAGVAAQEDDRRAPDIEGLWQLLEYRDANGDMTAVPPGIGATILPFAGNISVDGACSDYDLHFDQTQELLVVQAPETVDRVPCDPAAQAVDDALYANLLNASEVQISGSILEVRDVVEEPLLTLTNAVIPADPTIARWELARIGAADGSIDAVIQGAMPWIEFLRGGRVVGSSGCGSFLGSWASNDTTIRIQDVAYRLADCTEPVQLQAEAIMDTFPQVTDFQMLPAGLTLKDDDGTTRLALIPAIDLANRTWTPVAIFDAAGEPLGLSDRLNTSAVRFGGGRSTAGTADGRSYCRGFDGDSLISGLALSTSGIRPLKGPCSSSNNPEAISDQVIETTFLDALRQTSSHALRGSELELMDAEGRPIMRLVPQAELVGPTWAVDEMDVTPNRAKAKKGKPKGPTPLTARFEDVDLGFVLGDTGASGPSGANVYNANYAIPGAAQIRIAEIQTDGRACRGARASKPLCVQERAFLALLASADGFIVRENDLRLLKGPRPILWFLVQSAEPAEG